ncbi:unannotated protein [freshwater metagenome]|uniref:Unannotated protein n=1 Tax=freshwater metagenome TaxID=449393 RepID=A0A6J6B3K3_9ZZZZ
MSPSSSNLTIVVRERPKTRVRALSILSPSTPSGTLSVRNSRDISAYLTGVIGGIFRTVNTKAKNAAMTIAESAQLNTGQ